MAFSANISGDRSPFPSGTFSRRLALAFATVAAITAGLSAVLLSSAWNHQFDQYLRGNLQRVADGISAMAGQGYAHYGAWTIQSMAFVPRIGTTASMAIQILDPSGTVVYDEATALSQQNQAGDQEDTSEREFVLQPQGPVAIAPIVVNGKRVGSVRVWAFGQGALLTDRDEQFRRSSLMALTVAALVAIGAASLAGAWYARMLVRPIGIITAAASALRQGDPSARTGLQGEDEIAVLGTTFDEMADAIEADRELERRLTADVAHELRTPLQAIQATVEAMQDGVLPADEERLGVVHHETVRLARLADAILELTRLERGSVPFEMERIDAARPVRLAVDAVAALVESCELTLSVDIAEGLHVNGDVDRLQQAVVNLLSNAARYTAAGGLIEISLREDAAQAVIAVHDTGIGIAEADQAHVFSRFWRADSARATASGGLGIGLAVTKEIVDRHRGTIGVESAPGQGTTFTIRLPKA